MNLKDESHVTWLTNWCKRKLTVFLNILGGIIEQLTEDTEEESIRLSLEDFMNLEFTSWLCICEHKYLKLLQVTLFDKLIDARILCMS